MGPRDERPSFCSSKWATEVSLSCCVLDGSDSQGGRTQRTMKHCSCGHSTAAYIQTALRNHPTASRHYEALSPSQRRRYLAWIESAKREETKRRRLEEAIRLLASGKVLGLK
jgi:Bacteriocin-protection, YdeI or OmpD-Associated